MMNNDRGRGASGPRKDSKIVERYSISPQLAPVRNTPMSEECLNSDVVAAPQTMSAIRQK